VHEGPGFGEGWAAGQGWTGGDPVQGSEEVVRGAVPAPGSVPALRALTNRLLDALEAGDIAGARATVRALRQLLEPPGSPQ
jgi:hypothetical protein